MQRQQIGNTNNFINTNTGFGFGSAIGGTYAQLPCATLARAAAHAVHDCSDPVKPKRVRTMRSREVSSMESWRLASPTVTNGTTATTPVAVPRPHVVVMPPRLWASWVLSRSLCG